MLRREGEWKQRYEAGSGSGDRAGGAICRVGRTALRRAARSSYEDYFPSFSTALFAKYPVSGPYPSNRHAISPSAWTVLSDNYGWLCIASDETPRERDCQGLS